MILLRNLDPKRGLCNGTRLLIKELHPNVLDCEILSGDQARQRVYIPRIDCVSSERDLPFQLCRRQFPVNVAFAITINKSQGQTLDNVGVYLPTDPFTHGQLYVALSRVKNKNNIKVVTGSKNYWVKNIVYKEVL